MKILHRCSCCTNVSSPEIANNPEDYKPGMSFYDDPRDPTGKLCSECLQDIEDANSEFYDELGDVDECEEEDDEE